MLGALVELIEDDNERYKVCACLPSFLACFIFQIYDISMVIGAILFYYIFYIMRQDGYSTDVDVLVPMGTLCLSFVTFFFGPIGLFLSKSGLLIIYNFRLMAILLYSISWTFYIFTTRNNVSGYLLSGIWLLVAIIYIWGIFVTLKAITYVTLHYRGYDDVDPATQTYLNDRMDRLMREVEEREGDEGETTTTAATTKTDIRSQTSTTKTRKRRTHT